MGYAFIGIVILLAARAIYQFIKTHKRNLLNSTLHSLYLMTLLWAICKFDIKQYSKQNLLALKLYIGN
jgi:uncharacterized protein involved in response to NO